MPQQPEIPKSARPWLYGAVALYAVAFLAYSQTWAYFYDEAYHLLAAQLINSGKTPYLDFCFPQTPLNAYWNAAWMRLLGQSWRLPHAVAAFLTMGSVALIADFVYRRFPVPGWRGAAAITAGLAIGLNALVFMYGSLAQPYGWCLFMMALGFRITLRAVDQGSPRLAALAGLAAGAAAASSLLASAAAPVLLIWLLVHNRAGGRWGKFFAFGAGAAVPFAPVLWLFVRAPKQTWFNVVQYHTIFRRLYWPETTRHDLEVLTAWIDSGQGLILALLALFGLLFVARRSQWPAPRKAEFYLCAWLSMAISLLIGRAHPTFAQYFLLAVPFLGALAAAGLYAIASRVLEPDQICWPVLLVAAIFASGLGRAVYDDRESDKWSVYERVAEKVQQVTPRDAPIFATEPVYFLTRRTPPTGLELGYTHKVHLPPAEAALLHILSEADMKHLVQTQAFATAANCDDDEIAEYGLKNLYEQSDTVGSCKVFWNRKK